MMSSSEALWSVSDSDLADLDPVKARDLLVECFLQAQGGTFKRAGAALDLQRDQDELRKTVEAAIRLKFKDLGCDFSDPGADDISKVADALAREARAWGTPEHVVEHHIDQMRVIRDHLAS
jgi:hypothetical protein